MILICPECGHEEDLTDEEVDEAEFSTGYVQCPICDDGRMEKKWRE